jgi:hypothetical protein
VLFRRGEFEKIKELRAIFKTPCNYLKNRELNHFDKSGSRIAPKIP